MRILGRLVEEQVLHDHAFHGGKAGGDMLRVRVGLRRILTFDVYGLETAVDGCFEHVGDPKPRL